MDTKRLLDAEQLDAVGASLTRLNLTPAASIAARSVAQNLKNYADKHRTEVKIAQNMYASQNEPDETALPDAPQGQTHMHSKHSNRR